jgi:hypothetical protein
LPCRRRSATRRGRKVPLSFVVRPSEEQVRALAPDDASLNAGRVLATLAPWSDLGHNGRAVWGACRGRAKAPYRVAVDADGPAYRCPCPSRKFPCKHALGLLLLWARRPTEVVEAAPPGDVAAWLAARTAKAGGANRGDHDTIADTATATVTDAPAEAGDPASGRRAVVDPQAAAARAARRTDRIVAGMAELDRWLGDLIRAGFGQVQTRPYSFWDAMAARLVDAQAPAAANQVRRLAAVVRSGDDWPSRMLAHVARLHLLAAGWARLDRLTEAQRADLRTAAGWPWPSEQVLAGPRESDRWYVLARSATEEERITALRTWLLGLDSGRLALVLNFARPGITPTWELWPGNVIDGDVCRFPGTAQLRVLVAERRGEPQAADGPPPAWPDLGRVADARGRALAGDPWTDRWPVSVAGVVPDRQGEKWVISDRDGRHLELAADETVGWQLLAASGGRPVVLFGEWIAGRVVPLGCWADGRMVVL